jgi:hypothetical protein
MEPATVTAGATDSLYVGTERDGGLLKRLGIDSHTTLDAVLCPECGLTRLYANLED